MSENNDDRPTGSNENELAQLRERIAGLERSNAGLEKELALARTRTTPTTEDDERQENELSLFKTLVDEALDGVVIVALGGEIKYSNRAFLEMSGLGDSYIGRSTSELVAPEEFERIMSQVLPELHEKRRWQGYITHVRPSDGSRWTAQMSMISFPSSFYGVPVTVSTLRDVSPLLRAEQERSQLSDRIIAAQREALRELGTPLIPITDDAIAMPIIGTIDAPRALQMMETLLVGISERRARVAIVDITGVKVVNEEVADVVVRAARAARLLGADVVLTGVQPAMAQALVELGVELSGVLVRSTFQSGIDFVLRSRRA
jgi:PAS domain S-box-containing protein